MKLNVKKIDSKLKEIAQTQIKLNHFEEVLQIVSSDADIAYKYNQYYKDDELESLLLYISEKLVSFSEWEKNKNNKVVFYDGFGLDRRGVSIVLNKAICLNGYSLVYISPLKNKNNQPTLTNVLKDFNVDWRYIDTQKSYVDEIQQLRNIFEEVQPNFAFFYTYPNDVVGTVVFDALKDKCIRCQIDLTDHAFWLGLNAFDLCNGGRSFAASVQHFFREIPLEKMTQLDANLFIDDCPFQGLPFGENCRFIFSGGSLYKTLGDKNNTFYRIVEHILDNHDDIKFLYAGTGDDSQMKKLIEEYPDRVFLIKERPDFYQIIQRCTLYLNTYPMFGGLMMRYAALAGKIPVTLKHGTDSDGILIKQDERQIEYDTYDELIADVDRLLSNKDYMDIRSKKLEGAVVTEECFIRNVRMLIEEQKTEFSYDKVEPVDTTQFRKEYLERFCFNDIVNSIANKRNKILIRYFPGIFIYAVLRKIYNKIRR